MYVGSALALIALGAILAFAVKLEIAGIDLQAAGVILMIVGVVGAIIELAYWGPRRRNDMGRDREVVRERDVY